MAEFKYMKLSPDASDLKKAHSTDAGFDIRTAEDFEIRGGNLRLVSTKLVVAIPAGYYGRIASKSGIASKKNIEVGAGVVDHGYSGEVKVLLRFFEDSHCSHSFKKGESIAQLVIEKIYTGSAELVESLDTDTERGSNGFGSTGV
jgi:dUTP pyrophosphatase